ncbi:hypothetical protein ACJX0J_013642, partial [Zea mays]
YSFVILCSLFQGFGFLCLSEALGKVQQLAYSQANTDMKGRIKYQQKNLGPFHMTIKRKIP